MITKKKKSKVLNTNLKKKKKIHNKKHDIDMNLSFVFSSFQFSSRVIVNCFK